MIGEESSDGEIFTPPDILDAASALTAKMTPNPVLDVEELVIHDFVLNDNDKPSKVSPWKFQLYIPNSIYLIYLYVAGVYGMLLFFTEAKWSSVLITFVFYMMTLLGVTAGAHRLFSHKSYKATVSLQIILMLCHCCAYQKTLIAWVRDHRLHHKYTDTDADPHNARRGFFYSHVGWLMVRQHPEVEKRKNVVHMEDMYRNPVVMFQKRNARWLLPLFAFIIPAVASWSCGESFRTAWFVNAFRIVVTSNLTFLSNSLTHLWGYKPYDKTMSACQNFYFLYATMGEGFHNYHHVFPWDYRTGEIGGNKINFITKFIDFCGRLGLAYDMKAASEDMVRSRKIKTGDGTDLWGEKEL